jgi:hypothetical protein
MPVRSSLRPSSLRSGVALLAATLAIAACSGATGAGAAGSGTGPAPNPAAGVAGPADPSPAASVDWVELLSPGPYGSPGSEASPAGSPTASPASEPPATQPPAGSQPAKPGSTAISTTKAAGLLSQVNHLLDELNGDLSNADAAANNPGE